MSVYSHQRSSSVHTQARRTAIAGNPMINAHTKYLFAADDDRYNDVIDAVFSRKRADIVKGLVILDHELTHEQD